MNETFIPEASPVPVARLLDRLDLAKALRLGWSDFRRAPMYGVFFSAVYAFGGMFLLWVLAVSGQIWWTLPAAAGFPILGPFIAVGMYEVSRRLETGEPLSWPIVLGVILRQKDRQIPSMAAVIVIFFLFWNFLAHMIFALFLGLQAMTNVSHSLAIFVTANGLSMLFFGTLVGAAFASILFSITVVSLPLLLDKEIDFVTAMITSVSVVVANPGVMASWGLTIAVLLFFGMLPFFMGMFIVLPLLGHASWHLYRSALEDPERDAA